MNTSKCSAHLSPKPDSSQGHLHVLDGGTMSAICSIGKHFPSPLEVYIVAISPAPLFINTLMICDRGGSDAKSITLKVVKLPQQFISAIELSLLLENQVANNDSALD